MSVPTKIQSNQVPLALSLDNVTYKNIVCKRAWNFNVTSAVNSEETDCGIDKGLGAPDWNFDVEGVLNTTPNSPTEMSAAELMKLAFDQTLIWVKAQTANGLGSNLFIRGQAYVTDFAIQNSVGNLVAFTATFNGTGTPALTPP